MADYGFTGAEARRFLEAELRRHAASTSFYWESEETEELLDLLVDAMAKLIAANNAKIAHDWSDRGMQDLKMPPGM
ncbi:MAG TPA: hypothetical protein VIJ39_12195 [Solirubrobacteraceae bacterium]|jgi:hypothetical protein